MSDNTLVDTLRERRATLDAEWSALVDEREAAIADYEARTDLTDEDKTTADEAAAAFTARSVELESEINALDERISMQARKDERAKTAAAAKTPQVEVVAEPSQYRAGGEYSYYKDLLVTNDTTRAHAPRGAAERIQRHANEMNTILPKREEERRKAAESGIDESEREFRSSFPGLHGSLEESPFESRANPSRETGKGGEFVPPLWLVEDDFIPALRAGRVIAPKLRNLPVPPGTDTIKLPKIKLGTEVAPQLMDNAGVASRDIETEYVEAAVKTLAGQEDVAIQLIEQSPGQVFDRVVQEDLLADYHLKVEQNVSFGKGENYTTLNAGTIKGLFPGTEWGAGKRTSTSGTSANVLLSGLNANWSHIAKERFNTDNVHHFINPAFGAYLSSVFDGTSGELGRPLFEATSFPSFNTAGLTPPVNPAQGYFGKTPLGPDMYISANIPPVLPQATTEKGEQKKILFAANKEPNSLVTSGSEVYSYGATVKTDDVWFFESDLRTRVLPEVLSGTLQIRFQVYAYVSLLVRYGPSLQFCGGKAWKVAAGFSEAPVEPALGGYAF